MQQLINSLENDGLELELERIDIINKSLNLSNLELTKSQFEIIIDELFSNTDLVRLNLSCTNLEYGQIIELIDALTHNNKLTDLDLSGNTVGNEALHQLVLMLNHNKSLVTLNLADNIIGEVGTEISSDIDFLNTRLTKIDLTGNILEATYDS